MKIPHKIIPEVTSIDVAEGLLRSAVGPSLRSILGALSESVAIRVLRETLGEDLSRGDIERLLLVLPDTWSRKCLESEWGDSLERDTTIRNEVWEEICRRRKRLSNALRTLGLRHPRGASPYEQNYAKRRLRFSAVRDALFDEFVGPDERFINSFSWDDSETFVVTRMRGKEGIPRGVNITRFEDFDSGVQHRRRRKETFSLTLEKLDALTFILEYHCSKDEKAVDAFCEDREVETIHCQIAGEQFKATGIIVESFEEGGETMLDFFGFLEDRPSSSFSKRLVFVSFLLDDSMSPFDTSNFLSLPRHVPKDFLDFLKKMRDVVYQEDIEADFNTFQVQFLSSDISQPATHLDRAETLEDLYALVERFKHISSITDIREDLKELIQQSLAGAFGFLMDVDDETEDISPEGVKILLAACRRLLVIASKFAIDCQLYADSLPAFEARLVGQDSHAQKSN